MKSRDFIKELQKLDPSGECELTIGGSAIRFVDRIPGYYDGPYDVLLKDSGGYARGMKVTSEGDELRVYVQEWEDLIWDLPDATLEVHESIIHRREEIRASREAKRAEILAERAEIEEKIAREKKKHPNPLTFPPSVL